MSQKIQSKTLLKFFMLVALLLGYFGYLSWEYDLATGGIIALLTWSFFVLCTPIADAGFILDFPIRLIFGLRMVITEIMVWVLAITINITTLFYNPEAYQTTVLTSVFYNILTVPYPYWSIILLCALGTFLSIHFGDEIFDATADKMANKTKTKKSKIFKYKMAGMVIIFIIIFFIYEHLIKQMGLENVL